MTTCYGRTMGPGWLQEIYETASGDAGKRARELRALGLRVTVGALGTQVTSVGRVKLTMVTVRGDDYVPPPERVVEL